MHDVIFFYREARTRSATCSTSHTPRSTSTASTSTSRQRRAGATALDNTRGTGGASERQSVLRVHGVKRYWRYSEKRMEELDAKGESFRDRRTDMPRYKRYLDEMPGVPVAGRLGRHSAASSPGDGATRLRTQKPEALAGADRQRLRRTRAISSPTSSAAPARRSPSPRSSAAAGSAATSAAGASTSPASGCSASRTASPSRC